MKIDKSKLMKVGGAVCVVAGCALFAFAGVSQSATMGIVAGVFALVAILVQALN